MAVLSADDRKAGTAEYLNQRNLERDAMEITKQDVHAAFSALDDWAAANQAAVNSAIPLPARNQLTTKQKAKLLIAVLDQRYLSEV